MAFRHRPAQLAIMKCGVEKQNIFHICRFQKQCVPRKETPTQNQTQTVVVTIQERVVYHLFIRGALVAETRREPREGRSITEIVLAMTDDPSAYAFHTEKVYETTVLIEDGQSVQLHSKPVCIPFTFVGGTVYTQDELQKTHPEQTNFLDYLSQFGPQTQAILTSTGHWLPLKLDELHIPIEHTAPSSTIR